VTIRFGLPTEQFVVGFALKNLGFHRLVLLTAQNYWFILNYIYLNFQLEKYSYKIL
jgi:hypothetical protein